MRDRTDRPPTPSNGEALLREVATNARHAARLVRELHGTADRVAAASELPPSLEGVPVRRRPPLAVNHGKQSGEAVAEDLGLGALRLALNDLTMARRAVDLALTDLLEEGDRVLDAFGARTRHILR